MYGKYRHFRKLVTYLSTTGITAVNSKSSICFYQTVLVSAVLVILCYVCQNIGHPWVEFCLHAVKLVWCIKIVVCVKHLKEWNMWCSVAANTWLGKQLSDPTDADRLHATAVGPKENTGFTSNNPRHVAGCTEDYPGRFVTDYMARYCCELYIMPIALNKSCVSCHAWCAVMVTQQIHCLVAFIFSV